MVVSVLRADAHSVLKPNPQEGNKAQSVCHTLLLSLPSHSGQLPPEHELQQGWPLEVCAPKILLWGDSLGEPENVP